MATRTEMDKMLARLNEVQIELAQTQRGTSACTRRLVDEMNDTRLKLNCVREEIDAAFNALENGKTPTPYKGTPHQEEYIDSVGGVEKTHRFALALFGRLDDELAELVEIRRVMSSGHEEKK